MRGGILRRITSPRSQNPSCHTVKADKGRPIPIHSIVCKTVSVGNYQIYYQKNHINIQVISIRFLISTTTFTTIFHVFEDRQHE